MLRGRERVFFQLWLQNRWCRAPEIWAATSLDLDKTDRYWTLNSLSLLGRHRDPIRGGLVRTKRLFSSQILFPWHSWQWQENRNYLPAVTLPHLCLAERSDFSSWGTKCQSLPRKQKQGLAALPEEPLCRNARSCLEARKGRSVVWWVIRRITSRNRPWSSDVHSCPPPKKSLSCVRKSWRSPTSELLTV